MLSLKDIDKINTQSKLHSKTENLKLMELGLELKILLI